MKKEEIISVLNCLDDWEFGFCTNPYEAADIIIYSLQDKTPKVITNEKQRNILIALIAVKKLN